MACVYRIKQSVLDTVAKNYGNITVPSGPVLDCTLGVNPYGLPQRVRTALREMDPGVVAHYPHDCDVIGGIAAKFAGVARLTGENVLLSCGSFDALCKLNKAVLGPNSGVMGVVPRFSAYVDDVNNIGAIHRGYPLQASDGYRFNTEEFLRRYRLYPDCPLVCVENPHNPTGQIIPLGEIEAIAAEAERNGALLLVDEAYGEYMPEENSAVGLVSRRENVAVCRSFSKGYGMAGLRIGYLVGHPSLIGKLNNLFVPYDCNAVARRLAAAMLREEGFCAGLRRRTARDKGKVLSSLTKFRAAATAESTPILLLYVEDGDVDLHRLLLEEGLLTVSGAGFDNLGRNAVRMMVSAEPEKQAALLERAQRRG